MQEVKAALWLSFWNFIKSVEFMKMVFDKGTLVVTGVVVAWVTTILVERIKRREAMTLELGKLRAAAFTRILKQVTNVQLRVGDALEARVKNQFGPEHQAALEQAAKTFETTLREEGPLLDAELDAELKAYFEAAFAGVDKHHSAEDLQRRSERLKAMRKDLLRFFPALRRAA